MNAYAVCIPEIRTTYDYYQVEPPETYFPCGIFLAETAGQAKADALRSFTEDIRSGVFDDDWTSLRVRKIPLRLKSSRARGEVSYTSGLWGLWPEDWPWPIGQGPLDK